MSTPRRPGSLAMKGDDLPNAQPRIINNAPHSDGTSVGSHILDGMPLAEVLENAKNASQIRYKILEKARKEDVILFVSESGSNVAAKVSELFMHSLNHLNTKVNARFLCYDARPASSCARAATGIPATCCLQRPPWSLARRISGGGCGGHHHPARLIKTSRGPQRLSDRGRVRALQAESGQPVLAGECGESRLTILNGIAGAAGSRYAEEMQRVLGSHFSPRPWCGSEPAHQLPRSSGWWCEIKSYRELERFVKSTDFVGTGAALLLANIAEQYCINLPDSERSAIFTIIFPRLQHESP